MVGYRLRSVLLDEPTAIVHDWFQGFHGAEQTVEAMRTGLFDPATPPDIYTFHAAKELLPPGLAAAIVKQARASRLPASRASVHPRADPT